MKSLKSLLMAGGLILFAAMFSACDDNTDKNRVLFANDSSFVVHVQYAYDEEARVTRQPTGVFRLQPGQRQDIQRADNQTVFWRHEPLNRVKATKVSDNEIVFTNR
jgi:hypothetical protein